MVKILQSKNEVKCKELFTKYVLTFQKHRKGIRVKNYNIHEYNRSTENMNMSPKII